MGKLFLFKAAVESKLLLLTIIGVLNSVISLGYYITVVRQMWFFNPEGIDAAPVRVSPPLYFSIVIILLAVIILGMFPTSLMSAIKL